MDSLSWKLGIYPLDVGHGDSSLIVFYHNEKVDKSILVDGGCSYNYSTLRSFIVKKLGTEKSLDAIIITHWDADHWNGINDLVSDQTQPLLINAKTVFFCQDPKFTKSEKVRELLNKLQSTFPNETDNKGITVVTAHEEILEKSIWNFFSEGSAKPGSPDLIFYAINCYVTELAEGNCALGQAKRVKQSGPTMTNQASISCLILYGDFKYLTSGDICEQQEIQIGKYLKGAFGGLNVTGMKISHHGSQFSSPAELFSDLNCRYCIISNGAKKDFPHHEVLTKISNSSIQMCYLTNDFNPQNILQALVNNSSQFRSRYLQFLERFSKFLPLLEEIDQNVEDLKSYDQLEADCDYMEDPIGYHIRLKLKKELKAITLSKRISKLEGIPEKISEAFNEYVELEEKIIQDSSEALRGNEDFSKVLSQIKVYVDSLDKILKNPSKVLEDLLETIDFCLNSVSIISDLAACPGYQNSNEIGIDDTNERQNDDPSEAISEKEKVERQILKPLNESLRKYSTEFNYQLQREFKDSVVGLKDYWHKNSIKKFYVAGSQFSITQSSQFREVRGDLSIHVVKVAESQTATSLVFRIQKNGETRVVEDSYLIQSELKNKKLLEIIKKEFPISLSNSPNRLENQSIEVWKEILTGEISQTIQEDEKFNITFKRKKFEDNHLVISLKLKSQSKFMKIKYMISNYPLKTDKGNKWVTKREICSENCLPKQTSNEIFDRVNIFIA